MTRTAARQLAIQLSFALNAGSDVGPEDFFEEDYFRALPSEDELFAEVPDETQMAYIRQLVKGIYDYRLELDDIISRYAQGWKISRISRTALAVLRCALYEIRYMPDIPVAAAINEAVELAKGYDEPDTVSFINGILGSYVRENAMELPERAVKE